MPSCLFHNILASQQVILHCKFLSRSFFQVYNAYITKAQQNVDSFIETTKFISKNINHAHADWMHYGDMDKKMDISQTRLTIETWKNY